MVWEACRETLRNTEKYEIFMLNIEICGFFSDKTVFLGGGRCQLNMIYYKAYAEIFQFLNFAWTSVLLWQKPWQQLDSTDPLDHCKNLSCCDFGWWHDTLGLHQVPFPSSKAMLPTVGTLTLAFFAMLPVPKKTPNDFSMIFCFLLSLFQTPFSTFFFLVNVHQTSSKTTTTAFSRRKKPSHQDGSTQSALLCFFSKRGPGRKSEQLEEWPKTDLGYEGVFFLQPKKSGASASLLKRFH